MIIKKIKVLCLQNINKKSNLISLYALPLQREEGVLGKVNVYQW